MGRGEGGEKGALECVRILLYLMREECGTECVKFLQYLLREEVCVLGCVHCLECLLNGEGCAVECVRVLSWLFKERRVRFSVCSSPVICAEGRRVCFNVFELCNIC